MELFYLLSFNLVHNLIYQKKIVDRSNTFLGVKLLGLPYYVDTIDFSGIVHNINSCIQME